MNRLKYHHGGSALGLALAAAARHQPADQAISPRHRGREYNLRAPILGKTERA